MVADSMTKRLYLHHHGDFQHQNCVVGLLHGSDQDGVVRIFVSHSYLSNKLFIYAAQFFPYQECNLHGTIFPLPGVLLLSRRQGQ